MKKLRKMKKPSVHPEAREMMEEMLLATGLGERRAATVHALEFYELLLAVHAEDYRFCSGHESPVNQPKQLDTLG